MEKFKKMFGVAALFVIILSIGVVVSIIYSRNADQLIPLKAKGNLKAALKIIEYTDFQCPACRQGAGVLDEFFKKYPDEMYVEYKHFPLSMHKYSLKIAIGAECASQQNKFWPYHDIVFEKQFVLQNSLSITGKLLGIAEDIGMDKKAFEACLDDKKAEALVLKEKAVGQEKKIKATPTYLVNGKMVVGGKALKDELDKYFGLSEAGEEEASAKE